MDDTVATEYQALLDDALLVAESVESHQRRLQHLRREVEADGDLGCDESELLLQRIDEELSP